MTDTKSSRPSHPALERIHFRVDQTLNSFDTAFARGFNVIMIIMIVISTVIFVMDTIPSFDVYQGVFDQAEGVIAIIFSVEYVLRLWVAPKPRYKYAISMFAIFDLLAVLPWYFTALPVLGFLRTFRMVRMLRVLRVLRLLKLSRTITKKNASKAEREASAFKVEMQILAIGMVTVWLIFSGIMYAIENPAGTKGYESVLSSMWYVIVTITTVGYGDVYPATAIGKAVASLIMLAGIGLIGTLTGIIGKAMMSKLAINTKVLDAGQVEEPEEHAEHVVENRECENPVCPDKRHHPRAQHCKTCGAKLKVKLQPA